MKNLIGFIFCLIWFFVLLWFALQDIGVPDPWEIVPDYPVKGESVDHNRILARMHYHGTLVAFRQGGKWYFLRNNQTCKLW